MDLNAAYISLDCSGWAYRARTAGASIGAKANEWPRESPTLWALVAFLAAPFMGVDG